MKILYKIIISTALWISGTNANALVVSDTIVANEHLHFLDTYGFSFDLAAQGYKPNLFKVSLVTLTFDFVEIIEDGDLTSEDQESIEVLSYFFNRIDMFKDVDTGKLILQKQPEDWEDISFINIALASYTDNLWLKTATLEAELTTARVPEASSPVMLGIGLLLLTFFRRRALRQANNNS